MKALLVLITGGVFLSLCALGWSRRGQWKERARNAEKINEKNRKAHEVQNRVTYDDDYRERVRREYDRP